MERILSRKNRALFMLASGCAVFGIWLLMFALSSWNMKSWSGTKNPPFATAVVWLELAESPEDAFDCLGPAPADPGADSESARMRSSMDRVNIVDFFFMPAYAALFVSIFLFLFPVPPPRFFFICITAAALAAWGADIRENLLLFKITSFASIEDAHSNIVAFADLAVAARIKWACLFGLCLAVPYLSVKEMLRSQPLTVRSFALAAASLCFAAAGIAGMAGTLASPYRSLVESGSIAMSAGWIFMMIAGGTCVRAV